MWDTFVFTFSVKDKKKCPSLDILRELGHFFLSFTENVNTNVSHILIGEF
jgi:hypothetical protein